ncbi:MAG TPA: hypothetical protein VKP69_13160 [Isosphaeraceae bacterium]|nr:hypothetical protein [Isosphaeraceae bacterium]
MRRRAARRLGLVFAVAGVAIAPRGALAQLGRGAAPGGPAPPSAMSPGMYANPYTNPYANPFLNPYLAPFTQAGPRDAALYFIAAQQAAGGIGSGQLSGVRPGPASARASAAATHQQAGPGSVRTSDIPGAGAAHFFGRSYRPGAGADRYYNRQGHYYSSRGH